MSLSDLLARSGEELTRLGARHTPAEIAQQPDVWPKAAQALTACAAALKPLIDQCEEVILAGAGSSYFVGVCAEAALALRLGKPVRAIASTEIVMDPENTLPRRPFALVSIARSGNSPEGNAAFALAESLRGEYVRHVAVTCNPNGELARLARGTKRPAGLCLLPRETNDRGLAMTSSFTSLVIAVQGLGFLERPQEYEAVVARLSAAARRLLEECDGYMERLAARDIGRAFFVGARPFFGAALESHLKVQELSNGAVVGKAEDTLGLRHGPMAALDARSVVVVFGSSDPYRRRYESDLIRELAEKGLGLARLIVAPRKEAGWVAHAERIFEIDPQGEGAIPDDLLSPVLVIPAQLLGLYRSLRLGLDPDAPSRSGVINRVVQGVTIYPFEQRGGVTA